jgi:hypothetical protein
MFLNHKTGPTQELKIVIPQVIIIIIIISKI